MIPWNTNPVTPAFADYGEWRAAKFNNVGQIVEETPTTSQIIASFFSKDPAWKWCCRADYFDGLNAASSNQPPPADAAEVVRLRAKVARYDEAISALKSIWATANDHLHTD